MNILSLTHGDGSNRTFQKLMATLEKGGHQISIVAWDRLKKYPECTEENGIEHQYILHGGGYRNRNLAIWYPVWMIRLFFYLLFQHPKLIWAANFETAFPAAVVSKITKIPFVYYIHDNLCLTYQIPILTNTIFKWLDRWTIVQASVIMVPDASRIEKHAQRYQDKFIILPNAPSLNMAPSDIELNNPEQSYDIYINGTLWQTRGIEVLLKAVEQVPESRILIAGNVPEKNIERAIQAGRNVDFRGSMDHEDALRLYAQSKTVFAFYDPSISININASPTKLYEAMLMGKPVIINSEVRISKNIMEWDVGYSCHYHDVEGLASILRDITDNPSEAERKGQNARNMFESRFAWDRLEPLLLETIQSLDNTLIIR